MNIKENIKNKRPATGKAGLLFLILSALAIINLPSCRKNKEPEFLFYLRYKENGMQKTYISHPMKIKPFFNNSISFGGYDTSEIVSLEYSSICEFTPYGSFPSFKINYITYAKGCLFEPNSAKFKKFSDFMDIFSKGKKRIVESPCEPNQHGVEIKYYDTTKTVWTTSTIECGDIVKPVHPDYSAFKYEVINAEEYITENNQRAVKVKAVFHCHLYNTRGDSLIIVDGEIQSLYFEDL